MNPTTIATATVSESMSAMVNWKRPESLCSKRDVAMPVAVTRTTAKKVADCCLEARQAEVAHSPRERELVGAVRDRVFPNGTGQPFRNLYAHSS